MREHFQLTYISITLTVIFSFSPFQVSRVSPEWKGNIRERELISFLSAAKLQVQ